MCEYSYSSSTSCIGQWLLLGRSLQHLGNGRCRGKKYLCQDLKICENGSCFFHLAPCERTEGNCYNYLHTQYTMPRISMHVYSIAYMSPIDSIRYNKKSQCCTCTVYLCNCSPMNSCSTRVI